MQYPQSYTGYSHPMQLGYEVAPPPPLGQPGASAQTPQQMALQPHGQVLLDENQVRLLQAQAATQAQIQAAQARQIQQQQQHFQTMISEPPVSGPEIDLIVTRQPPVEIRTRTPNENRTFDTRVAISGPYQFYAIEFVKASLVYSCNGEFEAISNQAILGGTRLQSIQDGIAHFYDLSMCEASTKHKEREFAIEFVLVCRHQESGQLLETTVARYSQPFYAYSHKKVLLRRKQVSLRAISQGYGPFRGGGEYHIVGAPFIRGPSTTIVFRTPHGDVPATDIEMFSDSVLFFKLPPYPLPAPSPTNPTSIPTSDVKCVVQVSNDGRTFSNGVAFVYTNTNTNTNRISMAMATATRRERAGAGAVETEADSHASQIPIKEDPSHAHAHDDASGHLNLSLQAHMTDDERAVISLVK